MDGPFGRRRGAAADSVDRRRLLHPAVDRARSTGRKTRTDLTFYATGSGATSWRGEGNRIELTPERKTWKPGERARILIQSPWDQATALLTLEREGIRSHRRFTVTSRQDIVEVPITEADIPNVFVSVVLVKGRTSHGAGSRRQRSGQAGVSSRLHRARRRRCVEAAAEWICPPIATSTGRASPRTCPSPSRRQTGARYRGEVAFWAMDYGLLSLTNYKTPDVVETDLCAKGGAGHDAGQPAASDQPARTPRDTRQDERSPS